MKNYFLLLIVFFSSISFSSQVKAGDFDWLSNLRVEAEADPSGFRVRLTTRFNIGDVQVRAVINQVDSVSDAYMIFRLGELSYRPINDVVHIYQNNKHKGWGRMAKDLGIKPGSKEFHALKQGHDLENGKVHHSKKPKNKHKAKGKNKNKHKVKEK